MENNREHHCLKIMKIIFIIILILGIFNIAFMIYKNQSNKYIPPITYKSVTNETLSKDLKSNKIDMATINNKKLYYSYKNNYYVVNTYDKDLYIALKLKNLTTKDFNIPSQKATVSTILNNIVNIMIILFVIFNIILFIGINKVSTGLNIEDINPSFFPKKQAKLIAEKPNISFDDVCGCNDLKNSFKNDIECLKNPDKLEKMGARMPKGVVLYGPPGTGKTLIAKAVAGMANTNFIQASGSDFVEMYAGVGAKRIRELYNLARKSAPCIVFIDEIDAVGGKRGISDNSERDNTINALLNELDGFNGSEGIITICATNRLDVLDPALIRPGRFDRQLAVPLPDKNDRLSIIKKYTDNKKFSDDVNFNDLATKTTGFSGAELETIINESALHAIALNKEIIDNDDVENAFYRIVMKGDKKKDVRSSEINEIIAYHEAGHSLTNIKLVKDEVPQVTIIGSTSGAGGVTFKTPNEDIVKSKEYILNTIKSLYAGRAAEYIYTQDDNKITTGASNDIEQATILIKAFIGKYGMGQNGLLSMDQFKSSDKIVLEEATKLSTTLYQQTIQFLQQNKNILKVIANRLIEKETISGEELNAIIKNNEIER